MRDVVKPELKRLSKEKVGSRPVGILAFKKEYPVIFAALQATFALFPSASCIAEQEHGGL